MAPSLSVIIPSYNRIDLLAACLESVCRHRPGDAETLVVDDASAGEAVTTTAGRFPAVRVVRLPRRAGFCRAANAGVRAARGAVVELLNDDTVVTAGWAAAARDRFADPRVAAVAPLVLRLDPHGDGPARIDSAGDRYYIGGVAGKRGHGEPLSAPYLRPRPVFGASASSAFYRRDAFLEAGGFPESFGAYFEDVDLSFRLRQRGAEIVYEPASVVYHRVSGSHGRSSRRLLEQQSRNEERVFWRNVGNLSLRRALPRHAAVLLAKTWRRWEHGGLAPFLFGRLRLLGELPELRRHRRTQRRLAAADGARDHLDLHFWGPW